MTNLIFGGINFVIILWIGRYVYHRWFKSQIIDAIKSKQQYQQNLNSELSGLENKIKEVSLDLVLQQEQATSLLQKVQKWQTSYLDDSQLNQAQINVLQKQIDDKNLLKAQNLAFNLIQKKTIKIVLPKVEQKIASHFADRALATQFLQQVCDKLDQN